MDKTNGIMLKPFAQKDCTALPVEKGAHHPFKLHVQTSYW